jgi:hypothetical protein
MHSKNLAPAGKAIELNSTDDGSQYLKAKVVEPTAIRLVDEGVYSAFSVGLNQVKIVKDLEAPGGRIVDGTFIETSLVDRPANPTCTFEICKRASDGEEWTATGTLEVADSAPETVKSMVAAVTKAHTGDDPVAAAVEKALTAERAKHAAELAERDAKIAALEAEVEKLAREPDPAKSPFRGTKLALTPRGDDTDESADGLREKRAAEFVSYLENIERTHPDPAVRVRATEQLTKLARTS